jgi:hypothetical protein
MGAGLPLLGQRKDGTRFPVDISLRPVLLQDELLVIGAIRDMSEQAAARWPKHEPPSLRRPLRP